MINELVFNCFTKKKSVNKSLTPLNQTGCWMSLNKDKSHILSAFRSFCVQKNAVTQD